MGALRGGTGHPARLHQCGLADFQAPEAGLKAGLGLVVSPLPELALVSCVAGPR